MKKFNYYWGILCLAVICLFSSCSTTKYGAHFAPSQHGPSNYSKSVKADEPLLALEEEDKTEETAETSGAAEVSSDALPEAVALKKVMTDVKVVDEVEFTERREQAIAEVKERVANMSRKEKRALRREIKRINLAEYTKDLPAYANTMDPLQDRGGAVNILALILAFLLPPLGVFIHQGEINNKFWISLILTLLGVLPGVIYSVLVVLGVV